MKPQWYVTISFIHVRLSKWAQNGVNVAEEGKKVSLRTSSHVFKCTEKYIIISYLVKMNDKSPTEKIIIYLLYLLFEHHRVRQASER